jgi:hypothetical protein
VCSPPAAPRASLAAARFRAFCRVPTIPRTPHPAVAKLGIAVGIAVRTPTIVPLPRAAPHGGEGEEERELGSHLRVQKRCSVLFGHVLSLLRRGGGDLKGPSRIVALTKALKVLMVRRLDVVIAVEALEVRTKETS